MKIAIIGNAGSGKSTLGLKLHTLLNIPLYHLDQYFWKPGWQEPVRDEFEQIHNQLCDKPTWIIEGMAITLLEYRIQRADVVIFLDFPTWYCIYRVFKRALQYFGDVYFASAKECPERGPTMKFLKFILNFNRIRRPRIELLLHQYSNQKKIFVVHNAADMNVLIQKFKSHDLL